MKDSTKSLTRSFSSYSFGVILSRVSGLARDVCLAFFFGTSGIIAGFMVAFRFANLLRRIIAESPLSSSFVPAFESVKNRSVKEGFVFTKDLFYTLLLLSTLLSFSLIALVEGFRFFLNDFHSAKEILSLTSLMFPSLIFITLYGLSSSFLQCEKRYFLPASAPIFFNLSWILWMAYAAMLKLGSLKVLSIGVVFAFFVQWLIVAIPIFRMLRGELSIKEITRPRLFHESLRGMLKPFLMGAIGIGATQINSALDSLFARFADPSGPAYLWYAIRVQQVPIALFGVAVTAAILPPLTRAIKAKDDLLFKTLFKHGFKKSFAFMSLSFFGLISLGSLATAVLFARGEFTSASSLMTSRCLLAYSLGLIPHGLMLILASSFYANSDFKTPMRASLYSVFINALLNAVLVFGAGLGSISVAIATSATSLFNFLYLYRSFSKKWGSFAFEGGYLLKYLIAGVASSACCFLYLASLRKAQMFFLFKEAARRGDFLMNLGILGTSGLLFLVCFAFVEKLFKENMLRSYLDRRK